MIKHDILFQFFSKHFPFNKEGMEQLVDSFEIELHKKETLILRPDNIDQKLKFIERGYIREYYTSDSKEVNINFYGVNEFATDVTSFFENSVTHKWQQCLTDVTLLTLQKSKLDQFLKKYSCGYSIVQASFQKALQAKESFERKKITQTTEQLYKQLVINKSDWLKHIPQYHIASYLNVTPETLSRIRKRIS